MRIEQDNIVIRSAVMEDAPLLNRWWNDGAAMSHAGFPEGRGQPLEETIAAIESYEGKLSQLCLIEIDGQPVGEMSFGIGQNEANPGWKICETSFQNRGYGRKIIRMTFDYLFTNPELNQRMPIHRLFWDTNLKTPAPSMCMSPWAPGAWASGKIAGRISWGSPSQPLTMS